MKKLISLVSLFCLSVFLPLSVMGEPIDREAVVKRADQFLRLLPA